MNYQEHANSFATKHGIKLTVLSSRYGRHFVNDTQSRYIFKLKLSRGKNSYTFDFGQSLAAGSKEPSMYDVLACLQKYDVGSFEDFCDEFGYDLYNDSYTGKNKNSLKIYNAVCKEFDAVDRLFSDILDELQEIN